ncbi:MAG: DUF58 domain-containing protein, partial [Chloroflexota bacterium]
MSDSKPTVRLNLRWLPGLMALLFVLQLLAPYRGWTILFIGLGSVWLLGYGWARSLGRGLRLTREMRYGWAQVGDRLEERFTLSNHSWLPALWVEVRDHSTLPGYVVSTATGISAQSSNTWLTHGVCARRGLFTLGPTTLRSGDPFGIFSVVVPLSASATLVVMPPVVPLPTIEVAPGGRTGEGRRTRAVSEPTVSASRVRDYRSGDDARWIHWRTSARRDELFVRMFDSAPAGDWSIVLDLDAKAQRGEGQDATIEHGVILAASLAERGLRMGRAVGLLAAGGEAVWLAPQTGEAQRWKILRALTTVNFGARSLGDVLAQTRTSFRQAMSLIIITPAADGAWLASLMPLLRLGIVPTILLLDPQSFGGDGVTHQTVARLRELGVAHYVITRDLLDRPELRAGQQGQWEWRVGGTGRAVAVKQPR